MELRPGPVRKASRYVGCKRKGGRDVLVMLLLSCVGQGRQHVDDPLGIWPLQCNCWSACNACLNLPISVRLSCQKAMVQPEFSLQLVACRTVVDMAISDFQNGLSHGCGVCGRDVSMPSSSSLCGVCGSNEMLDCSTM